MSTFNNFNFGRPRCAESLPRIPPYNICNNAPPPQYSQATMSTGFAPDYSEITLRPRVHQQSHPVESQMLGRPSAAGTFFGIYGVSSGAPHSVPAAKRSSTLGNYGRGGNRPQANPAKRSSLGHSLLLDKGGNALDDFYRSIETNRPTQFIVGRQTSSRPHHVCYSLQVSNFSPPLT